MGMKNYDILDYMHKKDFNREPITFIRISPVAESPSTIMLKYLNKEKD